ncbi:potassium channel family protein [Aedoeadaptatus acetigenes]|uniref:potassium channel family protein n=1 Tax=Aedoeadaptatus acetigenes TaxID=2981723 RepID=UPI0011DD48FC|nr:TrkA family potassium uptake protein [Aedoeadaptatus acetigenes]MCU6785691.1 TrkA family potassium uptake protein [Aedoeadaptatus acetigenes]
MVKSFIVFGLGRLGSTVAKTLYNMHNDVLAVDMNPERVKYVSENVTTAIEADLMDEDVFDDLGLSNFDCAVIAIGSSLDSAIMATIACVEAGIPLIVAKAPTKRYGHILKRLGAHTIIYPEIDMGMRLAKQLTDNGITDYFELSDDYGIVEYEVAEDWVGKSIRELQLRSEFNVNVIAIRRAKDLIVRHVAEEVLNRNDIIIFFGSDDDLKQIQKERSDE